MLYESDVVYIPRLAFPVIPYAKALGKTVIVHLHDYIPVSYSAAILAPTRSVSTELCATTLR